MLMAIPGPPMFEQETARPDPRADGQGGRQHRVPDHRRLPWHSYEELKGRGVEFVEEPEERPYGIDAGIRDPSGNHLRLTQVTMAGV